MRELFSGWYPIVWEEMVYWRRRFWLYLAVYTLSPLIFLLTFGFGVGQRLKMLVPGGMAYLEFLVPGVVALAVFNNGVTSVTVRMFYNRLHFKSFEAYRLAPVENFTVWLGYTLSGALRGLLAGGIVLGLVLLFVPGFRPAPAGIPWLLAVAFSCGAFGVFLGLCLRSFDDQTMISEFVIVPMTFLCGTLIPLERLPEVPQHLVWFLPLTPATQVLRDALTGGMPSWTVVGLLAGWTGIFFALGMWQLGRRED
ncbi:ABC transporter permease [Desulforudis sp. DRI-14]|uniref:ABC transporter permease n=1 Tax=Desulforudis sp. DRI-14 TaxID=3459793 RepID=UPI004041E0E2